MPQREVIRPQWDTSVVIKLDTAPDAAIQREGRYGVDYEFRCNDDQAIMWLPKEGRDALLASGVQAGEAVQLVKCKRGKNVSFVAERVVAEIPKRALPESKPGTPVSPATQQLAGALCAAIDAVAEAQTYATNRGLHLQFGADDVRAIALSVYIGNQRNGAQK